MLKAEYSFSEMSFGPQLIRDLLEKKESVNLFAGDFFSLSGMREKIKSRVKFPLNRKTLAEVLKSQNSQTDLSDLSKQNIASFINESTFAITTGHQLNILTGPLYSIYKIAQVLVFADELKKKFPEFHFVPVFWMASEDHDFEEISQVHLFNKKITWNKPGQDQVIAGKLKTDSLPEFFDEVDKMFNEPLHREKIKSLCDIYLSSESLAGATRKLMNALFGKYGLVIVDGNDVRLKKLLVPVLKEELRDQVTYKTVSENDNLLKRAGYHNQVHVRECNLFFIHDNGRRERIVFENGQFRISGKNWSMAELEKLAEEKPELFSPNALLRPVYQELVLPNLAYIGGAGEISYWLQLRNLFEKLGVSFPMLRVRDSVFVMNSKQRADMEHSGISLNQLQSSVEEILKNLTLAKHGDALQFTDAEAELLKAKSKVLEKINRVDPGLSTLVEAEFSKMITALEKIEAKLIKAQKTKDESSRNRISRLRDRLFPQGHFQERHENVLNYYPSTEDFIERVVQTLKPEDGPKIRILNL